MTVPSNFNDFITQLSRRTAGLMVNSDIKDAPSNFRDSLFNAVSQDQDLRSFLNMAIQTIGREHTPREDNLLNVDLSKQKTLDAKNDAAAIQNMKADWLNVDNSSINDVNPFLQPDADDAKLASDIDAARNSNDKDLKNELVNKLSQRLTMQFKQKLENEPKLRERFTNKLAHTPTIKPSMKPM